MNLLQRLINAASRKKAPTITFLGMGNMAKAIVRGLSGYEISALDPKPINLAGVKLVTDAKNLPSKPDVVVLSVKPDKVEEVLSKLSNNFFKDDGVLVSVAAGVSIARLQKYHPIVIRVMPNTPMTCGFGVSAVYLPQECAKYEDVIWQMFGNDNNKIVYVSSENEIDKVTPISGSGPAYFFLLAELLSKNIDDFTAVDVFNLMLDASKTEIGGYIPKNKWSGNLQFMIDEVRNSKKIKEFAWDLILSFAKSIYEKSLKIGFNEDQSKILVMATMRGAAEYGLASKESPEKLKENVTSKGGATAAAREVFESDKNYESLNDMVFLGLEKAYERTIKLG